MDKNTIIAIALSVAILGGWVLISSVFFPKQPVETTTTTTTQKPVEEAKINASAITAVPLTKAVAEETKTIRLKSYEVTFSNKGGVVTSFKINDMVKDPDNQRRDDDVEMIYAYDPAFPEKAKLATEFPFTVHFGPFKSAAADDLFLMRVLDGNKIEFSRDFLWQGVPFNLKKTFSLKDGEYILNLSISLTNSVVKELPDIEGVLYTLGIGPQIGPAFAGSVPNTQTDYRKYVYLSSAGRQELTLNKNAAPSIINGNALWVSIIGKYYTLIASTHDVQLKRFVLDSRDIDTSFLRSAIFLERKADKTNMRTDEYSFYIGPKRSDILAKYADLKYGEIAPVSFPFGWIAELLKYPLDFFGKLVGNYGIAIIILTLLIKILVYPLTRKSFDSMKKMQALGPKMNEIRERLKDDPKRMNMEIAELYKREGVSPLGGCLPQLLQLPIMFALYILFNEYFALKNAAFLGWITDLSSPESIGRLPFEIPFLGQEVRLLPIIMVATQFLSTLATQAAQPAGGDTKMKWLPYIMMAVFFFILYNLPSGLVLYWTAQNVFTVLQNIVVNLIRYRKFSVKM